MSYYDYRFETHWRARASVEEIIEILPDAHSLPRWWPEVYLAVRESEPGVFALQSMALGKFSVGAANPSS